MQKRCSTFLRRKFLSLLDLVNKYLQHEDKVRQRRAKQLRLDICTQNVNNSTHNSLRNKVRFNSLVGIQSEVKTKSFSLPFSGNTYVLSSVPCYTVSSARQNFLFLDNLGEKCDKVLFFVAVIILFSENQRKYSTMYFYIFFTVKPFSFQNMHFVSCVYIFSLHTYINSCLPNSLYLMLYIHPS